MRLNPLGCEGDGRCRQMAQPSGSGDVPKGSQTRLACWPSLKFREKYGTMQLCVDYSSSA